MVQVKGEVFGMGKDLEELSTAASRFRAVPFPTGSTDERASQLHAELVAYDSYAAGLIESLLGGAKVSPESLRPDTELRANLNELIERGEIPASRDSAEYLRYLNLLEDVMSIARGVL